MPPEAEQLLTYLSTTLSYLLTTSSRTYTAYILPLLPTPLQSLSLNITTILSPLLHSADGSLNLAALAYTLIILYTTLKICDFIRRSLMSWIRFFVRIGLVLLVVQMGVYVKAYGWERSLRDAGWVAGVVWGWCEEAYNGSGDAGDGRYPHGVGGTVGRGQAGGKGWGNDSGGQGRYGKGRSAWN